MKTSAEAKGRNDVSPVVQRVLGAIVLAAVALVAIPALFDFSSRRSPGIDEALIPPRPDGLRVEVLPLSPPEPPAVPRETIEERLGGLVPTGDSGDTGRSAGAAATGTAPPVDGPPAGREGRSVEGRPVQAATGRAGRKVRHVGADAQAWVVQVGSFGQRGNARRFLAKIEKAGFSGLLQTTKGRSGKVVTRVLVGPVSTKEAARALRHRLEQSRLAVHGLVRPHGGGAR